MASIVITPVNKYTATYLVDLFFNKYSIEKIILH